MCLVVRNDKWHKCWAANIFKRNVTCSHGMPAPCKWAKKKKKKKNMLTIEKLKCLKRGTSNLSCIPSLHGNIIRLPSRRRKACIYVVDSFFIATKLTLKCSVRKGDSFDLDTPIKKPENFCCGDQKRIVLAWQVDILSKKQIAFWTCQKVNKVKSDVWRCYCTNVFVPCFSDAWGCSPSYST